MLIKHTATVSFITLISRILGYIRDVIVAATLGAGLYNDLLIVALRTPNLFRSIFGEGAFSASFVPIYSSILCTNGQKAAQNFARLSQTILCIAILIFCTLLYISMPVFVKITVPGFTDPKVIELAITLSRITTPYLAMISLVALYGSVLNSHNKYFAFAAAPIILNISMIIIATQSVSKEEQVFALSQGILIAGVFEMLWMLYFLKRNGLLFFFCSLKVTNEVRALMRRMIPGLIGAGVTQINIVINSTIASFIPHAMSYLYYADRIYQLPLGLLGTAVGVVILPVLSKAFKLTNMREAMAIQNRAIELLLALSIPASAALFVLSFEIIRVLFEYGSFTRIATTQTAVALQALSIGLPASILIKVFVSSFHASTDTKTPVKIAGLCIVSNAMFSLLLMHTYQQAGIAFAGTISAWLNLVCLYYKLQKSGYFKFDVSMVRKILKYVLNTIVMVSVMLLTKTMLKTHNIYLQLTILCGLGGVSYVTMCCITGVVTVKDLKNP
ncbi:murein biosynthesis integral membrane protein MurJ [Rickettsiales endosymbiont of Peranema trichophorum]|uniref:murein biosynthesis integral membrane protein MurJ n=1 Tax=Rickettsiales endosymbiont of Peranema trichophorum TaxID=2486577 RepID=UPI001022A853|nr:murein biosynthesis integral membrane protein MurJ [Rickettsiales endosymbiont of Peranema trichophorum]RZI47652.1 murein biosynthesis integral membrane protein MurJ [Rickettsiales endosymbiont of Peranema trichophorum]